MNASPSITFRSLKRKWMRRAEEAGARDGKRALPGVDDVRISDFEQLMVEEAEEALRSLESRLQAEDAQLLRKFAGARSDFVATKKRYQDKRAQLGDRPIQVEIGAFAYWMIILLVVACELPVNLRVFIDLFPDSNLMSWLAASSLTLLLLVLSHFAGKSFHQGRQRAMAVIAIIVSAFIIAGLAYLRQIFFSHPEEPDFLSKAFGHIDPNLLTIFFVAINAALIVVGIWLGMKRHDTDQTYEQRWREYQRARAAAIKLADRRDKTRALYREAAGGAVSMLRKLLGRYREVNTDNRELKATPRVWIDQPIDKLVSQEKFNFDIPGNELELD